MEVIRYCPFCKIEHEVTCCVQYVDKASLNVYRCNKFNRTFKKKEYDKL